MTASADCFVASSVLIGRVVFGLCDNFPRLQIIKKFQLWMIFSMAISHSNAGMLAVLADCIVALAALVIVVLATADFSGWLVIHVFVFSWL